MTKEFMSNPSSNPPDNPITTEPSLKVEPASIRDEIEPATVPPSPSTGQAPRRRRVPWRLAALLVLAGLSIPAWRAMTSHAHTSTRVPVVVPPLPVAAARVTREDLFTEVTVPAE